MPIRHARSGQRIIGACREDNRCHPERLSNFTEPNFCDYGNSSLPDLIGKPDNNYPEVSQ